MWSGVTGNATRTNLCRFNGKRSREVVTTPACFLIHAATPPTKEAKASRYIVSIDQRVMKLNKLGINN
jgi:hypothetical protein